MDDADDSRHARAPSRSDLVRLCDSLRRENVRYVLIGGFALILHGIGRTTFDVDLLVDDSPENVARLRRALATLEDNAAAALGDGDVRSHTVVRIADEIVVDLLGQACGVTCEEAARDATDIELDGVPVRVASKRTLVRTKQTLRGKDAADCAWLEERIAEEHGRRG